MSLIRIQMIKIDPLVMSHWLVKIDWFLDIICHAISGFGKVAVTGIFHHDSYFSDSFQWGTNPSVRMNFLCMAISQRFSDSLFSTSLRKQWIEQAHGQIGDGNRTLIHRGRSQSLNCLLCTELQESLLTHGAVGIFSSSIWGLNHGSVSW